MRFSIYQTVFHLLIVCSFAFEDVIYVYGEGNKEMAEQGRTQYQIIKQRGALPKYGRCWRSALENLKEGCRQLSEDTQSDIALQITNCFLEMSGHETYDCVSDKKPHLRAICISNMSDRAFNVYTEFYTHTQNICWFLRGQIWHETIAENTLKVGKQLEVSAEHQRDLMKVQRECIELQQKMLMQERFLEKVLEEVYSSVASHQEILKLLTHSVTSWQTWIVGEISWIDSIIFNVFALFLLLLLSSSQRTAAARLPLLFLLGLNVTVERLICSFYTKYTTNIETHSLYSNLSDFVWYSRYGFSFLCAVVVLYVALTYQNMLEQNLCLLATIKRQNSELLKSVEKFRRSKTPSVTSSVDFIAEDQLSKRSLIEFPVSETVKKSGKNYDRNERESSFDLTTEGVENGFTNRSYSKRKNRILEGYTSRYQLRSGSRQGTPDSGVVH